MSDFRKPRPDYPIVPQSALYRTERPTYFKRPKGRRGKKTKGKKVGKFVAYQDPNFLLIKKADEARKARELAVATARRRQALDVEELEDIKERRIDRPFQRQLALDRFALEAGRARQAGRYQGQQLQLIADVARRIEVGRGEQTERQDRNQERLYGEMREVYDRGERRAGERERMMLEAIQQFRGGGGRVDEGRLIALDERVRMVERSQTPQAQRDAARLRGEVVAGRGHVSEVSGSSSASEIDLPTPGQRIRRRAKKKAGKGSPPRERSESEEQAEFRRTMSRAVHQADVPTASGGETPSSELVMPEPDLTASQVQRDFDVMEAQSRVSLQLDPEIFGEAEPQPEPQLQPQPEPQPRSPSVEIATQTDPRPRARVVQSRLATGVEEEAEVARRAQAAEEPSPKRPVEYQGSYAEFKREAKKRTHTPRERTAEERHYGRQPSPAAGRLPPQPEEEGGGMAQAVGGAAAAVAGGAARAVGGLAQGVASGLVAQLPEAPTAGEVGGAVGRGLVGVAVGAGRGVMGMARLATAASPEPLLEETTPYEQLLAHRKPKQSMLFKESKKGTKKPDHPVNLGTETYEGGKKFVITDVGGKIKSGAEGRRYVVYGMGGSESATRAKDIGYAVHTEGEPLAEGEREFGSIQEGKFKSLLDSGDLELDISEGE